MSYPSIEKDADSETDDLGFADEVVTIRRGELEELRALAQGSSRDDGSAGDTASHREEAFARELEDRDRKLTHLESAYHKALRDRELATALAGKPLVSGAASQLIKLWRDDLDVFEDSGEYKVVARDGQPVSKWVAERLGDSDFAHFCLPSSRGGSGARGLSQSGPSAREAAPSLNLGEAIIAQWRDSAVSRVAPALGPAGWGRRG